MLSLSLSKLVFGVLAVTSVILLSSSLCDKWKQYFRDSHFK